MGDFYHLMKKSFPFGQNFIGLQSSPGPHSFTCNPGKSSQHLLIIFPWLLSFQRVSYRCQAVMERGLYLHPACSITVINNSNKNQNKDLPSRLPEIEGALFSHFLDGKMESGA